MKNAKRLEPGCGEVEICNVHGRSVATRLQATNPLKLLALKRNTDIAWIYSSTFGGGLVSGDQIDLNLRLAEHASCFLGTQASTKVYPSVDGQISRQRLTLSLESRSTCVVMPDPITCFAGANYTQSMDMDCASTASLILVDWMTSGRRAYGERWGFTRFSSRLRVRVEGKPVLNEALLLDPGDGILTEAHRMGEYNCLALVLVLGNRFKVPGETILKQLQRSPVEAASILVDAASPIQYGIILKVLGRTTEVVSHYLKNRLTFLSEVLSEDPWKRKW